MKKRVYNIDQKILVKGDPNLLREHELLVDEDIKNGKLEVALYKRSSKGNLEAVTPTGGTSSDDWNTINSKAYGIEWNVFGDTMDCKRIGNMEYHRTLPCHQWKGCIANAEKINYYLDANDWNKKADGTPSVLDGSEGTVRVEIPTFYYKSWAYNEGTNPVRRVMVSPEKIDDTWYEFPHILLDAYYATLDQTNPDKPKAVSVVNTTPEFRGGFYRNSSNEFDANLSVDPRLTDLGKAITNLTLPEMSNFAKNADSENLCYDFYKMIVFWMPAIEYATLNHKKAFSSDLTADGYATGGLGESCLTMYSSTFRPSNGYDRVGCRTPNGFTNEFGNNSGVKLLYIKGESVPDATAYTAPNDVWVHRYRGIENLFGDTGYLLDGILGGNKLMITNDPSKFTNNPSDMDRTIIALINTQMPHIIDFPLYDSCELIGTPACAASENIILKYTTLSEINNSIYIIQICAENTDSSPLVFVAGGFSSTDVGGPGFLFDTGYSLGYSDGSFGFRTLSRINGDSKKLQYREIV